MECGVTVARQADGKVRASWRRTGRGERPRLPPAPCLAFHCARTHPVQTEPTCVAGLQLP